MKEEKVRVTTILPTSIVEELKIKAEKEDRTVSVVVSRIIKEYFSRHKDQEVED